MKTQHQFSVSKRQFICRFFFLLSVLGLSAVLAALLQAQAPINSPNQVATGSSDPEAQQRIRDFKAFVKKHSDESGRLRQDLWLQGIDHLKRMEVVRRITIAPKAAIPRSGQALQGQTFTLQWQQIGPQPVIDGNIPPFSGEVTDIAIDPRGTTDQWIYIATNDGGIWKTTDGGITWFPKTDRKPSNSMGAVALDPNNPSIVYAGTGNRFNNGFFKAIGVYRSTDGGETWTIPAGSSLFSEKFVNGVFVQGKTINRIVVPKSGLLLVGTSGGLFKSLDRGEHYGNNPPTSDDPGFVSGQPVLNGVIDDIDIDTTTPGVVYACVEGVGLMRSTDYGSTFGPNMFTTPVAGEPPLPTPGYLSFAQSTLRDNQPDSRTMYLNVQVGQTAVVFRSDDSGATWARCDQPRVTQVGYDQTIGVDPQDPSRVYIGLVAFYKSDDYGQHFDERGRSVVHADHHALVFSPSSHRQSGSPTRIWVGTDGGIYSSRNAGDTWSDFNNTIATNLFRYIDIGRGSNFNRGFTYGGAQDNGTSEHRPDLPGNTWHEAPGAYGDGAQTIVDPTNPLRAYSIIGQPFFFRRTVNGGRSWLDSTFAGQPNAGAPLAIDAAHPQVVYASGGNFIIRSTDYGEDFRTIYAFPSGVGIQAVSLSYGGNVMWVGMSDGTVWRSMDLLDKNGNFKPNPTFTSHVVKGAPNAAVGSPQGIAIDPNDSTQAVLAYQGFTGFTKEGRPRHVFRVRTDQYGNFVDAFDTNISGTDGGDVHNLPDVPLNAVVIDSNPDPKTGKLPIIVASDIGVFRTTDDDLNGANWDRFDPGLPVVDCTSLAIDSTINPALLRVGTYGRSTFELKYLKDAPIDVTAKMAISRSGLRFDGATGYFVQDVTFKNRSSTPIDGPAFLVLDGLDSNVRLVNNNGVTGNVAPLGSPYIILLTGVLPPSQQYTLSLQFANPGATGITYSTRLLAGGNFP